MTFWPWLLAASLAAQSLAEVAEKERERRKRNAEAGVEVVSYTSGGSDISVDDPEGHEPPAAAATAGEQTDEEDVSPLENARERGKFLEPRMAEISAMADWVDGLYQRYLSQCYGRYLIGETPPGFGLPFQPSPPAHVPRGRDWFTVLNTPSALTPPVPPAQGRSFILVEPPQCASLREELLASANGVKRAMQAILDLARREGILPGVVRELREKYQLEWSGWER